MGGGQEGTGDRDRTRHGPQSCGATGRSRFVRGRQPRPSPFTDPNTVNIHRNDGWQLTFGKGLHYCLGANLARLEGRVAFDELVDRRPEWGIDYETAQLAPTSTVRGWERSRILLP